MPRAYWSPDTENENRGNLAALWLDLTMYGSILHKLITKIVQRYHMPANTQRILQGYFHEFKMRFTVGNCATDWQRLEGGLSLSIYR